MNKIAGIAVGAMAICGVTLLGGGFASAVDGTDVASLIPDTITLSVNESEYVKTDSEYPYIGGKVNALVKESVTQSLTDQSVDFNSVNVDCGFVYYGGDFYTCTVGVSVDGDYLRKDVQIQYANTSDANAAGKATLQVKFATVTSELQIDKVVPKGQYLVSYHMYPVGTAAEVIAADNTKALGGVEKTVKALLGDAGYNIYVTDATMYGTALGYVPAEITSVMVFKDGEFYGSVRAVDVYSYYDGETISMTPVAKDSVVYTEMATRLTNEGYKAILGAYELKLNSGEGRYLLSFDVDSRYNGKTVVVLHKIADGNYEEFERVVTDGKVNVEVSSLSPFMIAAKEAVSVGAPDTGVADCATPATIGLVAFGLAGCLTMAFFTGKGMIAKKKA